MYFQVLQFLKEQSTINKDRWFTALEIKMCLERHNKFSRECLRRALKKLRKREIVEFNRIEPEEDKESHYRQPLNRPYIYKLKEENNGRKISNNWTTK